MKNVLFLPLYSFGMTTGPVRRGIGPVNAQVRLAGRQAEEIVGVQHRVLHEVVGWPCGLLAPDFRVMLTAAPAMNPKPASNVAV